MPHAIRRSIHHVNGAFVMVNRHYFYRNGTYDFNSIFWQYFTAPEMQYIYRKLIYASDAEVKNSIVIDNSLLSIAKQNCDKSLERKVAESIIVGGCILSEPSIYYPVAILGLKYSSPTGTSSFFEKMGFVRLKV
ncbi:MAG: hypothetical protein V1906_01110 [Candidatus Woesearchaeota archaeon]